MSKAVKHVRDEAVTCTGTVALDLMKQYDVRS